MASLLKRLDGEGETLLRGLSLGLLFQKKVLLASVTIKSPIAPTSSVKHHRLPGGSYVVHTGFL